MVGKTVLLDVSIWDMIMEGSQDRHLFPCLTVSKDAKQPHNVALWCEEMRVVVCVNSPLSAENHLCQTTEQYMSGRMHSYGGREGWWTVLVVGCSCCPE